MKDGALTEKFTFRHAGVHGAVCTMYLDVPGYFTSYMRTHKQLSNVFYFELIDK